MGRDVGCKKIGCACVIRYSHEAGGVFTDLGGSALSLDTRSVLAASNEAWYRIMCSFLPD